MQLVEMSATPSPSCSLTTPIGTAASRLHSLVAGFPLRAPPVLRCRGFSTVKVMCMSSISGSSSGSGSKGTRSVALTDFAVTEETETETELAIADLGIDDRIVAALAKRSIINLFPIQRAVLEPAMQGRDIIARAKTGTGKTLAFGLPMMDKLSKEIEARRFRPPGTPKAIILAPTRELAKQVETELALAAPHLAVVCIYGGVSIEGQRRQLERSVDIVVGTPGRVIDMIERGSLRLNEASYAVLDEADQMLAVGFAEEVEKIMEKLPLQRQSMLFSATMPPWISNLSRRYLKDPVVINLVGDKEGKIAEGITLYAVQANDFAKGKVLADLLMVYGKGGKAIVFTKTKRETDDIAARLNQKITCEALHGDISQYQREKTLSGFRDGRFHALVATDVAARGLDVPNVDLVVHYEAPGDSETFVHRTGRTGRAGKKGTCILMYSLSQRRILSSIQRDLSCKFQDIAPPTSEEVILSSSDQAEEAIKSVDADVTKLFLPAAERLLEEFGVNALAAAMAQVSGLHQLPPRRSLITQEEGYMTLQLTGSGLSTAAAVTAAVSHLDVAAGQSIRKVILLRVSSMEGGIFDLPEKMAKDLLKVEISTENILSAPKVLPELQVEYYSSNSSSYGAGGRGFSSSYGSRSGYDTGRSSGGRSSYGGSGSYGRGSSYGNSTNGRGYGNSSYSNGGSGSYTNDSAFSRGYSRYPAGSGNYASGFSNNGGSSPGYGGFSNGASRPGYSNNGGSSPGYGGFSNGASRPGYSNNGGNTGYGGSGAGTGYSNSSGYGSNTWSAGRSSSNIGYGSGASSYGRDDSNAGASKPWNSSSSNLWVNPNASGGASSFGNGGNKFWSKPNESASDAGSWNDTPDSPASRTDYGWRKGD